ncbi:DNA/RNA nuclease SfsA [Pararhizobium mangrovi]|uniref:Sugar fermentation stimulation protein homolog n=1 Tax=Pararhizobium mangrovi TaxID=2590452 RepID=A0A506U049_9HYPH|nr:DNA/RNA nuclease SfsA [Pararhizobium mangrovi]TPW26364.1 DNA/RNA nuclease SfsA [Pararhizobium mangrovi]
MLFAEPLTPAVLVRRYKRFLFDARLDDGRAITGSCPNTGSMMGLTAPGSRIWLSEHDSPTRKYRHALELVEADGTIVGINTGLPNRLAEEAILAGLVSDLASYAHLKREQKYGQASRIDLLLDDPVRGRAYVEVKNVHLMRKPGLAEFPDSITSRGARHLQELAAMVASGHRAIMLFVIQRRDCRRLQLCRDLDKAYCAAFDHAIAAGVEAYALRCEINTGSITPSGLVPIEEAGVPDLEPGRTYESRTSW